MNHTSDKHKWFLESRSSRDNPYRDWYVWHDGKGETDTDKGTAAQQLAVRLWPLGVGVGREDAPVLLPQVLHPAAGPELEQPKVHEAFKDIIKFWLKRGVAGFRFDAITTLFEDPRLRR